MNGFSLHADILRSQKVNWKLNGRGHIRITEIVIPAGEDPYCPGLVLHLDVICYVEDIYNYKFCTPYKASHLV